MFHILCNRCDIMWWFVTVMYDITLISNPKSKNKKISRNENENEKWNENNWSLLFLTLTFWLAVFLPYSIVQTFMMILIVLISACYS